MGGCCGPSMHGQHQPRPAGSEERQGDRLKDTPRSETRWLWWVMVAVVVLVAWFFKR